MLVEDNYYTETSSAVFIFAMYISTSFSLAVMGTQAFLMYIFLYIMIDWAFNHY